MYKSKLSKVIVSLLRRIAGVTRSGAKRLMRAMLQALMAMGRRARLPVAGFVLPTVTMVLLVVILLTVAIVLRSFDRANMARNVRVNQQVLAAATPALDRAKAKINELLDPKNRESLTPDDQQLYRVMSSYTTGSDRYTFGDETRLKLSYPLNGSTITNAAQPQDLLLRKNGTTIIENEAINTAWRYPVDTNNDGLFDSFTLYGIFFRRPPLDPANNEDFKRVRKPLDARTPPMSLAGLGKPLCPQGSGTSASLGGTSGWEPMDGKLKKSFFVYTVNVPMTPAEAAGFPGADPKGFTGTSSISALEYQQDQSLIPLSNNAVVYEDDLDISPGPDLNLNGRVFTNSNLLVSGTIKANSIKLFQVSSKQSCFYEQENSKIVVGGNVVNGWAGSSSIVNPVVVHLFKSTTDTNQPNTNAPVINTATQSVQGTSLDVLYNNDAYSNRLAKLVEGQTQLDGSGANDPPSVKQAQDPPLRQSRDQALEDYFKQRLRKVPFAEASPGTKGLDTAQPATSFVEGSGETLRAKIIDGKDWNLPTGTALLGAISGSTNLNLVPAQPPAQPPEKVKSGSEENLGDRVIVGNNLPAQRWDGIKFITATDEPQKVDGTTTWEGTTGNENLRTRKPQVTKLAEVGAIKRGNGLGEKPDSNNPFKDGFWEKAAAEIPQNPLSGIGGLRVITSAGVYERQNSFLPPPKWIGINIAGVPSLQNAESNTYDDPATPIIETFPVVWPDTMPMSPLGVGSRVFNNQIPGVDNWLDFPTLSGAASIIDPNTPQYAKGDLRMRATAVYHYAKSGYNPDSLAANAQPDQTPIACVSSYYDPSSAVTARNVSPLEDVSGQGAKAPEVLSGNLQILGGTSQPTIIGSNNGITYTAPTRAVPAISTLNATTGLLENGDATFQTQANFVFPDGRFANGPLRTALQVAPTDRTLAQQAAIDSTWCALKILDNTIAPDPALIPHGAIQEVAFLNGREIKAVDRDDPATAVNEAFTLSSPLGTVAPAAQLTGNYNQPLEEREPLEIRATQLDITALRGQDITGTNTTVGEWLLPNSGIIYASRDDALPDRSARSTKPLNDEKISPTDNLLDPARKPNGIVLINGQYLFRGKSDTPAVVTSIGDVVREKGLILVSNLPAYIKGTFNPHGNNPPVTPPATATFKKVEEFTETVDLTAADPSPTFYARSTLNPDFACRKGDPRLTGCGGDFWRPATVLADAVTLLSQNYRFGFRNEGDFDLRNNAGAAAVLPRRQQGFFNNNFVTNGLSSGAFSDNGNLFTGTGTRLTDATYVAIPPTTMPLRSSSYFNNFVTPVQRRGPLPEYVMEVCTKLPVSECGEDDWFIDPLATTPRTAIAGVTPVTPYEPPNPTLTTLSFQAGSTVDPPVPELQRFPRRVAFNRTVSPPTPLGIDGTTVGATATVNSRPLRDNSLWFAAGTAPTITYEVTNSLYLVNGTVLPSNTTIRDGSSTLLPDLVTTSSVSASPPLPGTPYSGSQPLLLPVLQIQTATADTPRPALPTGTGIAKDTGWIPSAVETTFNLIIGAGDTPSRALDTSVGDFNGGLQNLPRFLESWNQGTVATNIQGSFIQQTRSAFSTAPYQPILPGSSPPQTAAATKLLSLFAQSPTTPLNIPETVYRTEGGRALPYFSPPKRNWGFDVGILSQAPDLFAQKFTTPSITPPAEYFREVGRDDEWVKTLMCGVLENGGTNATSSRPTGCP
ncbi:hypothetical protein C7B69_04190 [filamentous cyanobacterium Phorm 46]|nr:hypothetical protein C7B69_04190 [filamentous cyanobacterium Phorm 46]